MPQKKHQPEEIVAELRQVDMLLSQGRSVLEAVRLSWPPIRAAVACTSIVGVASDAEFEFCAGIMEDIHARLVVPEADLLVREAA